MQHEKTERRQEELAELQNGDDDSEERRGKKRKSEDPLAEQNGHAPVLARTLPSKMFS